MKECDKLAIAGIVAEFNPFHNGHKYIIDCAKADGHTLCAVISGNFVQRGDSAIISKFERARQCLLNGVDIVCELQCPWSMSTAQNFAYGAVSQLNALGVNVIYFGSESGDINSLIKATGFLYSDGFEAKIKERLKNGETFAKVRQDLLSEYDPQLGTLLSGSNDTLGIEYIAAANRINTNIKFVAVKRRGAMHNDTMSAGDYSTATLLREAIHSGSIASCESYVPNSAFEILKDADISDISKLERPILSKLRTMTEADFSRLPDISEGLDKLLFNSVRNATTLDELYSLLKSKRYTLARLRRVVLAAYLDIDNSYFRKKPPYVRILGFKGDSIARINKNDSVPIITKVSQIEKLSEYAKKVFETECRATDLYGLTFDKIKKCGADMTTPIVKV